MGIKLNQVSSNMAKWQMHKQESKNNFLNILHSNQKESKSRNLHIIFSWAGPFVAVTILLCFKYYKQMLGDEGGWVFL